MRRGGALWQPGIFSCREIVFLTTGFQKMFLKTVVFLARGDQLDNSGSFKRDAVKGKIGEAKHASCVLETKWMSGSHIGLELRPAGNRKMGEDAAAEIV